MTTTTAEFTTTRPQPVRDTLTMLRRNLKHAKRYPSLAISVIFMPVIFLLLFVYVFGEAMSAGLGGDGSQDYLAYLVPGILLMTIGSGTVTTAVSIATDMTEGIVSRFRTMAISRSSLLGGHVFGSVILTMVSVPAVLGIAVLMGFRPNASVLEWLGLVAVVVMTAYAFTWLAVALGLVGKTPEGASNLPIPLVLLPMLGSGFVPTDSMPTVLRWFAEYQPFTPIIETVRGLLTGTPIGNSGWIATVWCVGIAVLGYLWARRLFARHAAR